MTVNITLKEMQQTLSVIISHQNILFYTTTFVLTAKTGSKDLTLLDVSLKDVLIRKKEFHDLLKQKKKSQP